ncbi:MAG TPA: UDP-3-O-(3-hydroxymyristoyl)glucosamine N-acyltransferase [Phycisphaerae bacterium]|nr:UDP-3-O-(3-hydroxymyristoyl)glucosamine N-acyltransferase [Phycisphaerae bacterium]
MKKQQFTVRTVAEWVGGKVEGDGSLALEGIAPVESAGPKDLTFAADDKRVARLAESKAAAAIVGREPASASMTLIRVDAVQPAVANLLGHLAGPEDLPAPGRHPTAIIAPDAEVAAEVAVGPYVVVGSGAKIGAGSALCAGVYVGPGVEIGERAVLGPNVVIRDGCRIGNGVRIGPNSVIGQDGFGYHFSDGVHHKVPHVGTVVIEDDVELGACVCVDRAKFGATRIGAGTKIDNLVQVAHNVQVGRGCLFAALVGIAGSATLGDYVVLGGHAGVRDNVDIGSGVQASAYAAIASNVADGEQVGGIPAGPARQQKRVVLATLKLPELLKRVKELEARLQAIESAKDNP